MELLIQVALLALGFVLLVKGADWFVEGASKVAGKFGIPQIVIGLTIVAQSVVPQYADRIRAVILCATLIYEIIGPVITKISLVKAGEIKTEK